MKEKEVNIQDNFLPEDLFNRLSGEVCSTMMHWCYLPTTVYENEDTKTTPGYLAHSVYNDGQPQSQLNPAIRPLTLQLNVSIISRIQVNLNLRLSEPYISPWHTDTTSFDATGWSNSIFYLNTCNGYTEFKDGTKVESVANRVVTAPLTLEHRGVTQTDEQTRYVINFNYLKGTWE